MPQVFDNEIDNFEEELVEVLERMEKAARAFVSSAAGCLKDFYQMTARYFVQERFELTLEAGPTKLSEMKQKVTALVVMVPTDAQKLLDDDSLWWHRSRRGGWRDRYASELPTALKEAVDALAGRLTPILEEYGYVTTEPGKLAAAEDKTDEAHGSKTHECDPLQMEWSQDMLAQVEAYRAEIGRALFLDSKIATARKLKKKYAAASLWDKA